MTFRRIALPASLALNVFLAVLLVQQWRVVDRPPPGPPSPTRIADEIAATLPSADALILREVFARHADQLDAGHNEHRGVPERLRTVLTAQPFDEAALRKIFADGRQARSESDRALEEAVAESLRRMSPEGRAAVARWEPRRRPPG
jgi:uncharacterized membrane protein